ncbi:uncharacterized protein LOC113508653 [Trichoplusia ni]|uniref:Uncharacterized protein LOC113508653 n=1 Tax=Trichoplusia ni TaxID=7111 RepID=A0A7E5X4H4_TRINI|nr:uncharacterized protein LOC113508653 [Trichoplusia ni]
MLNRMRKWCLVLKICVFFTFVTEIAGNSRKYDVENEAMKLYSEDFKSVLRRFRRTPDYLKILSDKMDDMMIYYEEMSLQVLHYYHTKMVQRIADLVGVARTNAEEPTGPTTVRV